MAGIFARIAAGEIPSYKCAESDKFYAFLDINPLVKGHTLVIPRREEDYIFDLEDGELAEMAVFAKRVARAIKAAFPCRKVGMAVLGLEVPHAHIHLVPMQTEKDMNTILSEANAQASEIRGQADAEASRIYRESYSSDPEFFEFYRTMESYRETLPAMDKVLSTDVGYFSQL